MPEEEEGGPCRFTELRAEGHKTRSTRLARSHPISILFLPFSLSPSLAPPARGRTCRQKHEPHWKCHYTGICLYFLYIHPRIRVYIYFFLRRIPRYCALSRFFDAECRRVHSTRTHRRDECVCTRTQPRRKNRVAVERCRFRVLLSEGRVPNNRAMRGVPSETRWDLWCCPFFGIGAFYSMSTFSFLSLHFYLEIAVDVCIYI